jgi:hypothetical protein
MTVDILGVRHHGPGCARAVRSALDDLRPDIVLIEGPPEGDGLLPLAAEEDMRPPVALLIYRPDEPRRAVFYPFAEFSPEWQAVQYGLRQAIPVRFCDLPQFIQLAREHATIGRADDESETGTETPEDEAVEEGDRVRADPIGVLAEAAGYADSELWWEEEIERRADVADLFHAILEAMAALRAAAPEITNEREAEREAWMRQSIRRAMTEGFERIVVICGAWHAPALQDIARADEDMALLRDLPRAAVSATWIPWTHFRLSYRSGYGAGITAPGWYRHLWRAGREPTIAWVAQAAQLLREERLDAPASGVIDAVRLADALAALRGRRHPGLQELRESILTSLCSGQTPPLQLIRERLEVGDVMGSVPSATPTVPLQRNVEEQQRLLRLKPEEAARTLDLDLRRELDRERSLLLHRLRLLGIPWGEPARSGVRLGRGGTFHEVWRLQWQMEFPLLLIERNAWGNTLLDAADAYVRHEASVGSELPRLTELLREASVAELPEAVTALLHAVKTQSAITADTRLLMDALLPLAEIARYGDVRGTEVGRIIPILDGLFERILIALPGTCSQVDDAAASDMLESVARVHDSVRLLDRDSVTTEWQDALRQLALQETAHALLRGWSCRLLLETGRVDSAELQRLTRLALSRSVAASSAAAWIEGLLRGSGQILLHEDGLWAALDGWLQDLDADTFAATLPLLRRAFSGFQPPERRMMGEKMKQAHGASALALVSQGERRVDIGRAQQVIPVLAQILGVAAPLVGAEVDDDR